MQHLEALVLVLGVLKPLLVPISLKRTRASSESPLMPSTISFDPQYLQ